MRKLNEYIKDCFNELTTKVSWPTWSDLQSSSIIVFVASLIIAAIVYLMDASFGELLRIVYDI